MKVIHETGTRKTAVARATLETGSGIIRVNGQLLPSLPNNVYRAKLEEPLVLAGDVVKKVDIMLTVRGGGPTAQAEAMRIAIAKSLCEYDKDLHSVFLEYDRGLLVADVRFKETHKPNTHGKARAKRQKSYR